MCNNIENTYFENKRNDRKKVSDKSSNSEMMESDKVSVITNVSVDSVKGSENDEKEELALITEPLKNLWLLSEDGDSKTGLIDCACTTTFSGNKLLEDYTKL